MKFAKKISLFLGVLFCLGAGALWAQEDETPAEKQYREDYAQYQKIAAIKDPTQRSDEFVKFLRERPKSPIENYVLRNCLQVLQDLTDQQKWDALASRADVLIKIRPRVGETYYFLGNALRQQNKIPEAMDALAKCYVLRCPASDKARQFLEVLYKNTHKGQTTGMNQIIEKARKDIGD